MQITVSDKRANAKKLVFSMITDGELFKTDDGLMLRIPYVPETGMNAICLKAKHGGDVIDLEYVHFRDNEEIEDIISDWEIVIHG